MTRGRKKPGRILFVGSGPGAPGLLTVRARAVLTGATVAFTDPDVPQAVLDLVGSAVELPEPAPPQPATGGDEAPPAAGNEAPAAPPPRPPPLPDRGGHPGGVGALPPAQTPRR